MHILEEIRDFFNRHKSEIARTTADADKTLQESLENIKESTAENVNELHNRFVEQSEQFKRILEEEKEAFEKFMTKMNAQFSAQMSHMPQLAKQLEEISSIPVRLDKLIDKVEEANAKLASDISSALKQSMQTANVTAQLRGGEGNTIIAEPYMPSWMKWTAIFTLVIIAAACIFNVITYFVPKEATVQQQRPYTETVQPVSNKIPSDTAITTVGNQATPNIVDSVK